jgi:hypothetical protein
MLLIITYRERSVKLTTPAEGIIIER